MTSSTPRYQIGRTLVGVARIWEQPPVSSADNPNLTKVDLARFSRRLEKSEKMSIMVENVSATTMDPWMKNMVSSAYCTKGMPPGRHANWNPDSILIVCTPAMCILSMRPLLGLRVRGPEGNHAGCLTRGESIPLAADRSPRR